MKIVVFETLTEEKISARIEQSLCTQSTEETDSELAAFGDGMQALGAFFEENCHAVLPPEKQKALFTKIATLVLGAVDAKVEQVQAKNMIDLLTMSIDKSLDSSQDTGVYIVDSEDTEQLGAIKALAKVCKVQVISYEVFKTHDMTGQIFAGLF